MEQISKQQIIESIGTVYENAKDCKLEKAFFRKSKKELELLGEYFKTTESQTLFIAMVFTLNYKGEYVDIKDFIEYFDCNPMKILAFNDDFVHLCTIGIFEKKLDNRRYSLAGVNDKFTINKNIVKAILQNLPMPVMEEKKVNDIIDLLKKLYQLGIQRSEDTISSIELFIHAELLIEEHAELALIKRISEFNFEIEDTVLYLYVIWKTISGYESVDLDIALDGMHDNESKRLICMQFFLSGEQVLIKNQLLEIKEAQFFNDTEIKLTDTSKQILFDCDIKLFINKKKNENIIDPLAISAKQLIFDPIEMQQLSLLQNLLEGEKLMETQSRLCNKGLPKGITALLHGAPGTGKTEIVKQIAKATNRFIMKVEISQSKSMWFGESEKIIKRIFTDYTAFSKECELVPILFFNEADAILSHRKEISNSSVSQTENTIQNILLEELENFEGILIATTNLMNNLDPAFERRFLFKVPFKKPSLAIRAQIWKSKLPFIDDLHCKLLAEKFEFSGGQIDNIIRKNEIQEIVYGTLATFENILLFCNEESRIEKTIQIGFKTTA